VLGRDENDMSVSLLIQFAGFKAFFGGDLEASTEAEIAARDLVMDVDLCKADHHDKCHRAAPCGNVPDAFIADPEAVDEDGTIEVEVDAVTSSYRAHTGNKI
jgi:hypothetical protein